MLGFKALRSTSTNYNYFLYERYIFGTYCYCHRSVARTIYCIYFVAATLSPRITISALTSLPLSTADSSASKKKWNDKDFSTSFPLLYHSTDSPLVYRFVIIFSEIKRGWCLSKTCRARKYSNHTIRRRIESQIVQCKPFSKVSSVS